MMKHTLLNNIILGHLKWGITTIMGLAMLMMSLGTVVYAADGKSTLSFAEVLETPGNKVARCLILDLTTGAKQRYFCMYGKYKNNQLTLTNRDNTADGKILAGSFLTYKKEKIGKQIQEWLGSRFDIENDSVLVIKTIITAPKLKIGGIDELAKLEEKFEINQNILHYELSSDARKIFTDRQSQGELYQFARAVHVSLPVYFHANNQLESTKATLNNKDKEIGLLNANLEQYHTLVQEVQTAQDKQIRIWIPELIGVSPKIFWLGVVILSLVLVVALFVFEKKKVFMLNKNVKSCGTVISFENVSGTKSLKIYCENNQDGFTLSGSVSTEDVKELLEARDKYWKEQLDGKGKVSPDDKERSESETKSSEQVQNLKTELTPQQSFPFRNDPQFLNEELQRLSALIGLGTETFFSASQLFTQFAPLIKKITGQTLSSENNLQQVLVEVEKELTKLSPSEADSLLKGVEQSSHNVESLLKEFNKLLQPGSVEVTMANIPTDLSKIVGNIKNESDVGSRFLALKTKDETKTFLNDDKTAPQIVRDYLFELHQFQKILREVNKAWHHFSSEGTPTSISSQLATQLDGFLKIAKDVLEPFQGESVNERLSEMVKIHKKDQDELNKLYHSWKNFSCEERDIYQSVARFKEFLDLIRKEAFDAFNLQEGSVDDRFKKLMRDREELNKVYQSWKDFSSEESSIYESVSRFAQFLELVKMEGFEKLQLHEESVDNQFKALMRNHWDNQVKLAEMDKAWMTFSGEKDWIPTRLVKFFDTVNKTFTDFKLPKADSVYDKATQLVTIYQEVGQREGIYESLLFEHFYLPQPVQKTIEQLSQWQKKITEQRDIRTWFKYNLLGEIIACQIAVTNIQHQGDAELKACLEALYMDKIITDYLEITRQKQFSTDTKLYNGLTTPWLHKVFRAATLLQTYYPDHKYLKELETHLRIITDMLCAVFVGLPELNIQFSSPTLLAATPTDCKEKYQPDPLLTKLRVVKDRVKQQRENQGNNKFIVDVETYGISDKFAKCDMVVIVYNPSAWQ